MPREHPRAEILGHACRSRARCSQLRRSSSGENRMWKASNISNSTGAPAKFEHQSKQALIGVFLNFEIRLVLPPKEHCLKSEADWPFV